MKTTIKFLFGLMALAIFAAAVAPEVGVNPANFLLVLSGIGGLSMCFVAPTGTAMTSVNIADLTTKLGAFSRANKQILVTQMLISEGIKDSFTVMDGVKDELPLPNLEVDDVIQPGNSETWNPIANSIKFGARIAKVRDWKIDLTIVPTKLEKTWLGQYYDKGSRAFQMPFEQFVFEHIVQKAQESIRLKALYKGVYNGAGTTTVAIFDGLNKIVADAITATEIVPVVTGAITSSNVVEKLEAVYDGLGEAYKSEETQMSVAPNIFDWYVRRYRDLYHSAPIYKGVAQDMVKLDGTNCWVMREPGLAGSQRVICTTKENKVYVCDSIDDVSNIEVQRDKRVINVLIDAKSGVQLKQTKGGAVSCNDQA
jgi:hypothetical protein